ncbi:MAG: response regulator [Woeseiaceae bacterium]|nr:response regulator [Woeseiaceae bacterium]
MKRVFIVDDHAPVIRVLKLGLEEAGYDVETANNGSECLVKLCDGLPDFLVTDIDMPRMSGKDLCLAIEKQFPERTFPIIVLTSRTEMEHREWTGNIENLAFMEKPVSIRRLVSHINRALSEPSLKVAG